MLSESRSCGYSQTSLTCDNSIGQVTSVTLGLGDVVTCTFVNDDVAPSLTLVKDVVNDNGGTAVAADWTLTAAGYLMMGAAGWELCVVGVGSCGYSQTSLTCDNSIGQVTSVTFGLGDDVTCTFVNDDVAPSLTLDKVVVNDNGGTEQESAWTVSATGDPVTEPAVLSGEGAPGDGDVTSGVGFDAGTYTLSESTGPAGYSASDWVCDGGTYAKDDVTGVETIEVGLGDDATCTITNDDVAPSLTLDKVVVNDNGGEAQESAWTVTATGDPVTDPAVLSGEGAAGDADVVSGVGFDAGTYVLSESTGPAGYSASDWVCVGGTYAKDDVHWCGNDRGWFGRGRDVHDHEQRYFSDVDGGQDGGQ